MLWTIISGLVLVRIGFFRAAPLADAPRRENQLSGGHLAAAVLLYLGAGAMGGYAGQFFAQSLGLLPPASPASATAPATSPARAASTATAPASLASTSAPAEPAVPPSFVWVEAGAGLAFVLLAAFLLLQIRPVVDGGLSGFGLNPRLMIRGVGLSVIAALLIAPWIFWVSSATEAVSSFVRHGPIPVHPILQALREERTAAELCALVAIAVICAPLIEEIIFRGLLQTYLLRFFCSILPANLPHPAPESDPRPRWRWAAILVASTLFAAIHIPIEGPEAFPPLFTLALTLGYLYERTGNLWACIALHSLFNVTGIMGNMVQHR